MDYLEYLRSPEWREFCAKALEYYGSTCMICNSRDDLQVHHRTYERLGQELITDVSIMCNRCHVHNSSQMPRYFSWLGLIPRQLFEGIRY